MDQFIFNLVIPPVCSAFSPISTPFTAKIYFFTYICTFNKYRLQ